jgi:uncharacterized iron-regulated protein
MNRLATLLLLVVVAPFSASCNGSSAVPTACGEPGQWLSAQDAKPTPAAALLDRMATQQAVLLGEAHDSAEDHRWQLHVLAQLHSRQPNLAIGFEMFPRRVQPVLDDWVAGKLSEQEFLKRSDWAKVWTYDARDYLPLFHFARMNRIPMLAVNVERSLTEAVSKQGWEAVPDAQKEGVTKPAPPSPEYVKDLRMVFEHHPIKERGESAFPRFVEGQTTWDRAMAQRMAEHLKRQPQALVVGIMGAGHVRYGRGVAHQLKDLGVERIGTFLTWDQQRACADIGRGLADAVYVATEPAGPAPRLGVATEAEKDGRLKITQITAGSVAETAGLKAGDVIVQIAGQPAKGLQMLRTIVQRQTPGTWLPLKIRRGGEEIEIVARFPADG